MKRITILLLLWGVIFLSQMNVIQASDKKSQIEKIVDEPEKISITAPPRRRKTPKLHLYINVLQYLDLLSASPHVEQLLFKFPRLVRKLRQLLPVTFPIQPSFIYDNPFDHLMIILDTIFNSTDHHHEIDSYPWFRAIFQPAFRFNDIPITYLRYENYDEFSEVLIDCWGLNINNKSPNFSTHSVIYHHQPEPTSITFWTGENVEVVNMPFFVIFEFCGMPPGPVIKYFWDFEMISYWGHLDNSGNICISFRFYIHHREMLITFFFSTATDFQSGPKHVPYVIGIYESCHCSWSYERWNNVYTARKPTMAGPEGIWKYECEGVDSFYRANHHFWSESDWKNSRTYTSHADRVAGFKQSNPWFYYIKSVSVKFFKH